jgi:hypothetical protein
VAKEPQAAESEQSKVNFLNYKAEREIEVLAVDLVDLGAKNYAAGLRMVIFTALNLLADLGEPGLATDIARVVDHCGLLIEELNKTAA